MANGTIAFDTLTTSDSVNTGTEKSIDTSYIFNGVVKAWCDVTAASSYGDSFNMASMTDHGASDQEYFYSNVFANGEYGAGHMCGDTGNTTGADLSYTAAPTTSSSRLRTTYDSNTAFEWAHQKHMYIGDLA